MQTLTSRFPAHFVDAAAGADAADDEHNDEDHKPRYGHADSDIRTIAALGEIMEKIITLETHFIVSNMTGCSQISLEKCKYNKSVA